MKSGLSPLILSGDIDMLDSKELLVVEDTDSEELTPEEKMERLQQAVSGAVESLQALCTEQINARTHIEERWLQQIRQYHGIYEPNVEGALTADRERSKVFINQTRPKTNSWEARLFDLLFPADEKNYGIGPTPVPDLVDAAKVAIAEIKEQEKLADRKAEEANGLMDQGAGPEQIAPVMQEAQQAADKVSKWSQLEQDAQREMQEAARRADLMEREVDDQLTEAEYPSTCRDVIRSAVKIGTGVLKGPITSSKTKQSWIRKESNGEGVEEENEAVETGPAEFTLKQNADPRPDYRLVDAWHFYPDMAAATMEDTEFTFERHLKNKPQFRKMTKLLGFDKEAVRKILREGAKNDQVSDLNYLTQLRDLEGDANLGGAIENQYVIWEYHGELKLEDVTVMLRGLGRDDEANELEEEDDPLKERMVVVYFCQGMLLKIAPEYPMDSGANLYNVMSFEKAEASILGGVGVPWLMRHEQAMLNSAVRLLIDNGALGSLPQLVVDETQIEPENGEWKISAGKVWKRKGQELGPNNRPFEVFNIPINQAALGGIIEIALKFIDDVVSMPMIAQGDQGQASQTLGGMSMLFNSANVVFRRVVKNWDDDITTPVIRRIYHWNMQFNPKEELKGDMQVEARGTSVLLVREIQAQQLIMITNQWSNHPVIGPAIKVWESLRMTLQALAINPDDIIASKEEFEKRLKDQAEAAASQAAPEQIRAEAQIEAATISAESRKADGEVTLKIAQLNRETEILKLISKEGVDLAKVEAMLKSAAMRTQSDERKLATEVAVEERNAKELRAEGKEATGSGGAFSFGSEGAA